ncbi:ankyrin repeat protein, putative [Trichomonas vaginalis G3]|uniref:Ankyrin repeat protein, putative n=1 Tax=Trichomonas vaginalis (strain ATCC PRA-98 / G3) TaxID=412133 RepID=A2D7T5_TRIV3|nr:protein ubiquitination [Trichomonas vaginalis G3]EAY23368.1 ankyrin repeat protein, putative [Trichomonas vaginalis G3]KAI5493783.1 protein ubiquitination [Trichomonas vaginalis G3]|eukprot:XP_001584354.1 ankyrin repeat protein [Trichomonas vaginalis G3]
MKTKNKSNDNIQNENEIFTHLFETLMLSSNDNNNNNNHKETKQFDKISTTDENINSFEKYWKSNHRINIYPTFSKCSQERDLYSIKFAVDNRYHETITHSYFWGTNFPIIHYAAKLNNLTLVQDLISCGVDLNMRNDDHSTPLHIACYYNSIDVVKFLLSLDGIDINAQDNYGNTPLHDATSRNNREIVEILLGFRGIDTKIKNNRGKTPMLMKEF